MNEQTNVATEENTQPDAVEIPLMASIEREYFAPAELPKAQEVLTQVLATCEANGVNAVRNFDADKDFPTGYGLAILPISKRSDAGNVVVGVAVAAVPDPETIATSEGGADYMRKTILDACIAKLANSVRPRGETDAVAASIPFSVQDFITSSRGGESMATFRKLAPVYVAALKKKGIRFMTGILLRQIFQSAAFAEAQFPKIPQEQWVAIMNSMIAKAQAEKLEVSVLVNWKETRAQAEMATSDIDLSDLGDLA